MDIQSIIEQVNEQVNLQVAQKNSDNFMWGQSESYADKPVEEWALKDFVCYFKDLHTKVIGKEYKIIFSVDTVNMQKLKSNLLKAGLTKRANLKEFLEWCSSHSNEIVAKTPNFLINDLCKYTTQYANTTKVAEVPKVSTDNDFWERIAKKLKDGMDTVQFMEGYGLPIVANYSQFVSGYDKELVRSKIEVALNKLFVAKKTVSLSKICKQSINLSPYPPTFVLQDWRTRFDPIWDRSNLKAEDWWRDDDYVSEVPGHYSEILK